MLPKLQKCHTSIFLQKRIGDSLHMAANQSTPILVLKSMPGTKVHAWKTTLCKGLYLSGISNGNVGDGDNDEHVCVIKGAFCTNNLLSLTTCMAISFVLSIFVLYLFHALHQEVFTNKHDPSGTSTPTKLGRTVQSTQVSKGVVVVRESHAAMYWGFISL